MLDSVLSVTLRDEKEVSLCSSDAGKDAAEAYEVEIGQDESKTNGDDAAKEKT